jgi:hypothetical protein
MNSDHSEDIFSLSQVQSNKLYKIKIAVWYLIEVLVGYLVKEDQVFWIQL